VSSAAGGNLSRMHKTQETAKESRLNFMYSHLRNGTLALPPAFPVKPIPPDPPPAFPPAPPSANAESVAPVTNSMIIARVRKKFPRAPHDIWWRCRLSRFHIFSSSVWLWRRWSDFLFVPRISV